MPKQISQLRLELHELANLLEERLLTNDKTSNIRAAIGNIERNNIKMKKNIIIISQSDISNTPSLSSNIEVLEQTFNQSIEKLKQIKSFIIMAKQAVLEPEPSFHNHSLIPTLEILNTFFSRKKHNEINEMIYLIKKNSKKIHKTFDSLQKTNFETNMQVLGIISCLDINLGNIICCIHQIQDILELPPQNKKAKKSTKV